MELAAAPFLYTLATLTVTFAGFSALLLIVRQAAGYRLGALDRFLTRTIFGHLFLMTGGALVPPLLNSYGLPEIWVWRLAALLFGGPMLALLLTYQRRRRAASPTPAPLAVIVALVWVGSASLIAMFAAVLGGCPQMGAAYVTALTVNFFTHAFGFVFALEVILHQPDAPPARRAKAPGRD